ncbi:MAG: hypothetical protein IPL46_06055 [Saprospiraceae bacterium]|nr:hypothetical protein [Saprospiraceae bacterium]
MRNYIIAILILLTFQVNAQDHGETIEGKISYKNSKNIYVRFASTQGIAIGDTLYKDQSGVLQPVLIVKSLSSISCVTSPITIYILNITDLILHKTKVEIVPIDTFPEAIGEQQIQLTETANVLDQERLKPEHATTLRGRLAVGAYTNFSDSPSKNVQRMRYTFSLDAQNINHSRLSLESYVMFRHTAEEWSEVRENLASALKVYSFAMRYEPSDQTAITIGRKINRNISNVGAMDGVQVEHTFQNVTIGGILGTRPDPYDYNLNLKMMQYGGYIAHHKNYEDGGTMQTSLAILEQKYLSNTDRRFVYFQHANSLLKHLNLFSSIEVDLFKVENEKPNGTMSPTSVFLSLSYRASKKLSLSASYDARKNVIYYETYKNFIDQLIEQETRQGGRFRFNYRPFKFVSFGSSIGYRFQKDHQNTSKNLYSFLSFSRIPWVKMSGTISNTLLKSNYLKGHIYGIRLSKDLLDGKLFSDIDLRRVNYQYGQSDSKLKQTIGSINLTARITKKLSVSVNYEATLEKGRSLNRIYSNIIQRF